MGTGSETQELLAALFLTRGTEGLNSGCTFASSLESSKEMPWHQPTEILTDWSRVGPRCRYLLKTPWVVPKCS